MLKLACFLVVLVAMTGCGGDGLASNVQAEAPAQQDQTVVAAYSHEEPEEAEADQEASAEAALIVPEVFSFTFGGNVIEMDQNINEVLAMLGEPMRVFEAPSCAFDGIDRVFGFPGVQIHTYPLDGEDFVHTISLRDDTVSTTGGIFLGQSLDDVIEVYGNDYTQEYGMFTFAIGQTTLSFLVENNVVIAITYGLTLDF